MKGRASLTMLMGCVAVVAVGLATMKVATEWMARGAILGSFVGLLLATVGTFVRSKNRASLIGLAVFGWGYVLIASGVPFLNSLDTSNADHIRDFEIWRVDKAVRILVDQLHPLPSSPQDHDPFPVTEIVRDPATGRPTKNIKGQQLPLSGEELNLLTTYEAQRDLFMNRTRVGRQARAIGLAIQGLAFALIGSFAGQALSDGPADVASSPGADNPSLPG